MVKQTDTTASKTKIAIQSMPGEVKFRETVSNLDKVKFRRRFQRRVKANEPNVVTVQDVKDVALYLAYARDLTQEFIRYYHIPTMDRFLRALIIYFQYYVQVWENLLMRREEEKRKLYQPGVALLENAIRDDLSDLRSMVAREYGCILTGTADTRIYHHMLSNKNNISLSDKDRRLFEIFVTVTARVILLNRLYNFFMKWQLETELNRMLRSDQFNLKSRLTNRKNKTFGESKILSGLADTDEMKLFTRSPLAKEMVVVDHDYRMLVIGLKDFTPKDKRLNYMEAAFSAPEEMLTRKGVTVGILGLPRKHFDGVLMPKVQTKKQMQKAKQMEAPPFKLPSITDHSDKKMVFEFVENPPQYVETQQTITSRKKQKQIWLKHVEKALESRDLSTLDLTLLSDSQLGLYTSRSTLSVITRTSNK